MNADLPPLVTVVIPVFNVGDLVARAIRSLQAQDLPDFEAIVVDDGSTDGSGAVAQAAFAGDSRFRLIRQENRGLSAARNRGLAQARGTALAFLDADDEYAPAFLGQLWQAMQRDGTDWAACGIVLCYPDGHTVAHSALHAQPQAGPARVLDLGDARVTAGVFPSAWNKLYRRAAFGDLRFPEGAWFEDHEVFWAMARRAPRLSYVPAPLYRHWRQRDGQITGTDSERVFDQVAVLERLHPVVLSMDHGNEGFDRLASRLVHERALVLRDPQRRARFFAAMRDLFNRLGATWSPAWDPEILPSLGPLMAGDLPLSIVRLGPGDPPAPQTLPDLEVVHAPDAPTPAALAARLQGRYVLMLARGEGLLPDGAMRLVALAETMGTALAFGGVERQHRGYHDGWSDNTVAPDLASLPVSGGRVALGPEQALRLHPVLANRIVARDLLARLPGALRLDGGAASSQALVLAAALAAGSAGYTRVPVATAADLPGPVPPLRALARWARALPHPDAGPLLPRGWRGTLFLRLARFRGGALTWAGALGLAAFNGWLCPDPGARPDPESPRWLRRIVRLCSRIR
ncbi:MAG: glycosyltransferase family 2 protein [Rhodobacteraceae bacterium]|nr:glycosyltransferase family 2 protein [Paracoccaceae bacterium]